LLAPATVLAHAFPERAEPRVGSTVSEPPHEVRIWFDSAIEPVFSTIRVEDGDKHRVDRGGGRVDPADNRILEVGLAPLSPGRYRVYWSVIARDGHRTEGDFSFQVK
jgi:hypothetical protein